MLKGAGCPNRARRLPHVARHRTVGELDEVERVLDVRIELIEGASSPELNWQAIPQFRIGSGCGPDVLGQLEVLEEPEAERLVVVRRRRLHELVVPAVDDQLAVRRLANRLLPLVARLEVPALDDATAGKAEEARMERPRASAPGPCGARRAGSCRSRSGRARRCRRPRRPGPRSSARSGPAPRACGVSVTE